MAEVVPIHYIEIPGPDLDTMKAFYGKAFGWSFQDWGPDYVSFDGAGVEGGFNPRRPPARGAGSLVILRAGDLEAAEAAIVEAGGTVTDRHEFPGGRRFHFVDPCGNELAVWTQA